MARFKYLKGDSFFHRMDPTLKIIWNFVIVITAIFNFDMRYSAIWYVYMLVLALFVARIPIKQYFKAMLLFVTIALFIAFWKTVYFVGPAHELLRLGPLRITQEGVMEGFSEFFRVLVICSLSIIFTLTTDPKKMVDSIIQVARVPYRIGYVAYATLRFIPLYENEAQVIINAHQIRGVGEAGKSIKSQFKLYRSLLVPLLVSGIRRAQASAIAMDSRAFGAYDKRTVLDEIRISKSEVFFVLAHVAVGAVAFFYFIILGRGTHFLG
jgi:energy-coupling factor transport system permease protein